jgi:HlyD family secretion protein
MAGQALFRIEPVELAEDLAALKRSRDQTAGRLELALSRASLDKDRTKRHIRLLSAAAAQARREAELQERLQAQGLASDQDRATALLELERQEAALSDAGADEALAARQADLENAAIARDREVLDRQIALAEARLAACRGRSPVDAVVLRINGEAAVPGAFVNRFQPLVEIAATGRAQAVFDLPLASRAAAAPGQAVRVLIQGREWPGRVAWVGGQLGGGRAADGGNGLRLVIDLESQEGAPGGPGDGGGHETSLVPGTPASLTLLTGVRRDVLALPLGPFLSSGKGLVAWRIEDGSAAKLAVRLNGNYDGMVVVEAGLAEGDRVLLSGHEDFAAFDRVEVAWTALPTIEKISSQEKNDD